MSTIHNACKLPSCPWTYCYFYSRKMEIMFSIRISIICSLSIVYSFFFEPEEKTFVGLVVSSLLYLKEIAGSNTPDMIYHFTNDWNIVCLFLCNPSHKDARFMLQVTVAYDRRLLPFRRNSWTISRYKLQSAVSS